MVLGGSLRPLELFEDRQHPLRPRPQERAMSAISATTSKTFPGADLTPERSRSRDRQVLELFGSPPLLVGRDEVLTQLESSVLP